MARTSATGEPAAKSPSSRPPAARRRPRGLTSADFAHLFSTFSSAISKRHDCGRFCAPLNGGQPVCCTTANAIPVVHKEEWRLLKSRTDLWRPFKPFDAESRKVVAELTSACRAVECKGAAFCERDNRSLACRAFPFFPYMTRQGEIAGMSIYWIFEDRCWVMSNLQIVEQDFLDEIFAAYEYLFSRDESEREALMDQSAAMRRVFSRWRRPIPLLRRDGSFAKVMPHSGGRIGKATASSFRPRGPYASQRAYLRAIGEENGDPATAPALPYLKTGQKAAH